MMIGSCIVILHMMVGLVWLTLSYQQDIVASVVVLPDPWSHQFFLSLGI